MQVNKYVMPIVTIVFLIGTVWVAKATGYWQTVGREMINLNQGLTAGDIRGWMTLEILSDGFDIPPDELRTLLMLPPDIPPATALKDLESIIEVGEVRAALAAYKGEALPEHDEHDEHDETEEHRGEYEAAPDAPPTPILPEAEATHAPLTPVSVSPEIEATHAPGSMDGGGQGAGEGSGQGYDQGGSQGQGHGQPAVSPSGQFLSADEIRGRMTLQEVSDQCGVPLDILYTQLDLPANAPANVSLQALKGYVEGSEVGVLREVVADYQTGQQ